MQEQMLRVMRRAVRSLRASEAAALEGGPAVAGKMIEVPGEEGPIQTWLHRAPSANRPLLVDLHGGGFVLGDARKDDALCAEVASKCDVNVVAVGYRLAPEHPWPAALEDVCAVLAWYAAHAEELGIDGDRLYLQGYSAGANLALAVALRLGREGNADALSGIVCHYPVLDFAREPDPEAVRAIDLPLEFMQAFRVWYVGDADARDPLVSPLFASDDELAGLPPVVLVPVVGDALCAEAVALAERLRSLGCPSTLMPVDDAYHGYIEDAANVAVYEATTIAETRDARPRDYVRTARRAVRQALDQVLGG